MRAYTSQRRYGKSILARLVREYVKSLGAKLISDETVGGLRSELFKLPSGDTWMFVSKVSREGGGAER